MSSYLLLNKQVLQFLGASHKTQGSFGFRWNNNVAKVNFVPVIQTAASMAFRENILQENIAPMSLSLGIQVAVSETLGDGSARAVVGMTLEAKGENHILHKIWLLTEGKAKLNWDVSDFGVMSDQQEGRITGPSCAFNVQAIIDCWKNRKSFVGTFTISVDLEDSPFSRQLAVGNECTKKLRKLLSEKIQTDTNLVSKDGRIVKCHRAIITMSSEIFERKLTQENGVEVDFMNEYSVECINALLSYIYYGDSKEINTSVEFVLQILTAALEFQLVGLISHVQKFLGSKQNHEFTISDAFRLYAITKFYFFENEEGENDNEGDDQSEESESQEEADENESKQDGGKDRKQTEEDQSEQEEEEDENHESGDELTGEENDDDSEEESSANNNDYPVAGKGIRIGQAKRKNVNENGNGKKHCNGLLIAGSRIQDGEGGPSGTSAAMKVTDAHTNGVIRNNVGPMIGNVTDDHLSYMKLLDKQADEVMIWYLNNRRSSFYEPVNYLKLVESRQVLDEFVKLSVLTRPQREEVNV